MALQCRTEPFVIRVVVRKSQPKVGTTYGAKLRSNGESQTDLSNSRKLMANGVYIISDMQRWIMREILLKGQSLLEI